MAGAIEVSGSERGSIRRLRDGGLAMVLFALGHLGGAAASAAAEVGAKPDTAGSAVQTIEVVARPLASFEKLDTSRTRYGRLEWIGGLVLTSNDARFGGWSGLALDGDGSHLVAVSDAGTWMTADLIYRDGRPHGLTRARLGPLKSREGGPLRRDRDRDAEAVILMSGTPEKGQLLISFEQNHRLGIFNIGANGVSPPLRYLAIPKDARRMQSLKGFEAVAKIRSGRHKGAIVAFAERLHDRNGHHAAWILSGEQAKQFSLTDIAGFDPTDAVGLANGDLILLERRFRWTEGIKMRIRLIRAGEIAPGAVIKGEVLIEANMAQEIDNMEAISAHRARDGSTVLTLMSDDNFNGFLQRTLLLQFRLEDEDVSRRTMR